MKAEDKELLLKDLCARLPYGVKVKHEAQDYSSTLMWVDVNRATVGRKADKIGIGEDWGSIEFIKPYLRPMSSMTDVEGQIYETLLGGFATEHAVQLLDWLNRKMFDYRGLIPHGLAIEVTKENNPYKET